MSNIATQQQQETVKLFSEQQVAGAAAGGGVFAGSFLMSLNFYRLGKKEDALVCSVVGIAAVFIVCSVAMFIPQLPAPTFIGISYFWAKQWYKNSQSSLFKQHIRNGGETETGKAVIGWFLVGLAISIAIAIIAVIALDLLVTV